MIDWWTWSMNELVRNNVHQYQWTESESNNWIDNWWRFMMPHCIGNNTMSFDSHKTNVDTGSNICVSTVILLTSENDLRNVVKKGVKVSLSLFYTVSKMARKCFGWIWPEISRNSKNFSGLGHQKWDSFFGLSLTQSNDQIYRYLIAFACSFVATTYIVTIHHRIINVEFIVYITHIW